MKFTGTGQGNFTIYNNLAAWPLNMPSHQPLSAHKMASALAKFLTPTLGPRQHRKIAILGLDEAGGIDLLKRLCGAIEEKRYDGRGWPVYYTGTNSSLKCDFDFVAVEVGGSGPPLYLRWMAAQFHDADGFVWVVDSADAERFVESRVEMGYARKGRGLRRQGGLEQAGVRPEVPWLVLVDFKQNPLV